MKKVSIILTLAVVGFVTSCGLMGPKDKRLKFTDAVKYNDYIVDIIDDVDRKSTRLNSSHIQKSRMPSSA